MKRKITTILLAIAMVIMMLPMTTAFVFAAESDTTEKNITLGAAALQGAQKSNVYYGTYKQSSDGKNGFNVDPIKWRVLSNGDGKLFLLADQNLDVFKYNNDNLSVTWETSTMRSWLNGYVASENVHNIDYTSDNFKNNAFSTQELAYILQTTLVNADNATYDTEGGNDTNDYVFLLSLADVTNTAYGFTDSTDNTNTRVSTNTAYVAAGGKLGSKSDMYKAGEANSWWLRSPGYNQSYAAYVSLNGYVWVNGHSVFYTDWAVRPAFNLNLSSVLFTSAAKGGKSAISENEEIANLTDNDGYKLTLLDVSRSGFSAEIIKIADKTYVKYQGATTGANEYITAMIVNAGGEVTYYGSLKNITETTDANGTIEIDFSGKLNSGDKVYILNEQWNGDYKTDYSSALNETEIKDQVKVKFDANGGTGTMDDVTVKTGDSYTLPECGFTYVGYSFKGWSYTADGEIIDTDSIEIKNVTTLYANWISYGDLIAELDKTVKDLEEAMKDGDKDLSDKIAELTNALNAAKTALENADADNKEYLEGEIANAKSALQAAIDNVASDLASAITDLNAAIDKKADTTTVNAKIQELQNAIDVLEAVKNNYVAADAELKTELETAIATAKSEAITAATKLVEDAKKELNAAIDKKADTTTVNAAIQELQNAIDALEAVKNNYLAADAALKTELETAIATAKSEAITAATKLVEDAKKELNAAIDNKADTTTVNAKIQELQNAIDVLEAAKNNYLAADTALKAELEAEINALKARISELENRNPMFKVENGKLYVRYDETEEWTCIGTVQGENGADGTNGTNGTDGKDGVDGITPKIRINSETDEWEVSYDNGTTWTSLGVKATGDKGEQGVQGEKGDTGAAGADGKDGTDGLSVAATAIGSTALVSDIALIVYALIKKKKLF